MTYFLARSTGMVLMLQYSLNTFRMGENGGLESWNVVYFVPQIKAKIDQN